MFRSNLDSTVRSIQGFSPNGLHRNGQQISTQQPPQLQTVYVASSTGNEDPPLPTFLSERKQMMVQEMRMVAGRIADQGHGPQWTVELS